MKLICLLRGVLNSLKTGLIVSGHDYQEIYDNKDIQVLKCITCNHISIGFKEG